jgi:hypothetical protein
LYVEINQVSPICGNLDVLCTHQFLHLSEPKSCLEEGVNRQNLKFTPFKSN